jgi:hypothetical protein
MQRSFSTSIPGSCGRITDDGLLQSGLGLGIVQYNFCNFRDQPDMLELRPNCELCDRDLPPDSNAACICSYECTFCRNCVSEVLENVCPNCGGGFSPRPIRPRGAHRDGVSLEHHPASTRRVHTRYSREQIQDFAATAKNIAPDLR